MRRMDAFFSADDRQEHLALLSQSASKHALDFLAWCLMSYHAHFVGLPRQEKSLALHVPEKSMQFSVKVGGSSVAGALPFLFDGRTERSGVTAEKFVKVSVSPSTIFGQIRLTRQFGAGIKIHYQQSEISRIGLEKRFQRTTLKSTIRVPINRSTLRHLYTPSLHHWPISFTWIFCIKVLA